MSTPNQWDAYILGLPGYSLLMLLVLKLSSRSVADILTWLKLQK